MDQGRQFEVDLLNALLTIIETQSYFTFLPIDEHYGWALSPNSEKGAQGARIRELLQNAIRIVLLALRNTVKIDIGSVPAELVYAYRMSIFIPRHNTRRSIFVPMDLSSVGHVYLKFDATRRPLQPLYEGPFAVLQCCDKDFKLYLNS